MGQSRFKWIVVFEDGTNVTFEGTFDELLLDWPYVEPIAIIRGEHL